MVQNVDDVAGGVGRVGGVGGVVRLVADVLVRGRRRHPDSLASGRQVSMDLLASQKACRPLAVKRKDLFAVAVVILTRW